MTRLSQAFKRCKLASEQKGSFDMTNKIFEHKNIFSTTSKLPSCVSINEDEFNELEFYFDIPHFINDFIKYITGGIMNPHQHYLREMHRQRYLDRINPSSPNSRALLQVNYTEEELNSVKFWGLVDPSENTKYKEDSLISSKDYKDMK